ncbi:MAG: hypothetical protein ACRCZD_05515 [Phycicoccus sp.]
MSLIETARLLLLIAHFVGLAALVGPFLAQVRSPGVLRLRLMLVGASVQLVSGNALIASNRLRGFDVDEVKMIVKLVISAAALGVLVVAVLRQRRRGAGAGSTRPLFRTAGGLGLANIAVAVVWT